MIGEMYIDACQTVLGCMLKDRDAAAQILLQMTAGDFLIEEHQLIFSAALRLFEAQKDITPVTVGACTSEEIHDLCRQLVMITPSSVLWEGVYQVVKDTAAIERAGVLADEICEQVHGMSASVPTLRGQAERLVATLGDADRKKNIFSQAELAVEFLSAPDEPPAYLDWGFSKLNRHVMCQGDEFIIIGARPSVGKTAIALQMARHMAKSHKVGFFSLETDRKKITSRLLSSESFVPLDKIKRRAFHPQDMENLTMAAKLLAKSQMFVVEAAGYTVGEIRRDTISQRFDVIFIDYLQLVTHENPKLSEYERVSDVSRALQLMAKELQVTVIALSQLSRNITAQEEPETYHLRASGQIEQDADVVLLLYLPSELDVKNAGADLEPASLRWLKIAKCKEGITGKMRMIFNGGIQRFAEEWKDFSAPTEEMRPEQMKIS